MLWSNEALLPSYNIFGSTKFMTFIFLGISWKSQWRWLWLEVKSKVFSNNLSICVHQHGFLLWFVKYLGWSLSGWPCPKNLALSIPWTFWSQQIHLFHSVSFKRFWKGMTQWRRNNIFHAVSVTAAAALLKVPLQAVNDGLNPPFIFRLDGDCTP